MDDARDISERARPMSRSKGSIAIEALLLVPALFVFATLIVFVSRYTDAAGNVQRAADVAARVASQSSHDYADTRARSVAISSLSNQASSCSLPAVAVRRFQVRREVHYEVRVSCSVNLRGLGLLSVGTRRVSATSSEVVDVYTNR